MEAPRNSFFDINNLLNNQEEENLYDNFENDLLMKIDSEYERKSNPIEEYAKEPINLTIKIGEKEIPITSFNCTKLENVTEEKLREMENKIEGLFTRKQKRDVTTKIKCARQQLLDNAEKIPTIIVDTEEFHITCLGYGEYTNLSEEQLKIIKNRMSDLPSAERNKLSSKLNNILKKKQQNQPKEILTIKIGEKEIPITSFNCTKLENVTKKKLKEMENKIKDLPTHKQKYDLTMRIKCARQLLKKAEKIPTIRVDTEEFHITCLGYGEYMNLSKEQLKIIKNGISDLSPARKHQLNNKLENRREKLRKVKDKEIPTIKIGEKEIPITSFNCTKLENVTKKKLREIENKIEDFFTRKQNDDLTMRIKCAKKQLKNAEKIPTIRVDTEEFHITCIGYGEYKNLSEEQLKIIKNQMSDLPYSERNKLSSKLSKVIKNKQNQSKKIPTIKIGKKEIPTNTRKTKKSRIAQDKQNQSSDHFKNKSFQTHGSLLKNNAEIVNFPILELDNIMTFTTEQSPQKNQQTKVLLNQINPEYILSPLTEDSLNQINSEYILSPLTEDSLNQINPEYILTPLTEDSLNQINPEYILSPLTEDSLNQINLENILSPLTEDSLNQINPEYILSPLTEDSLNQINPENILNPLKSKKRRWDAIKKTR